MYPRGMKTIPFMHYTRFIAFAVLLSGCAMGPNYERPEVVTPSDWRWKNAEPRDTDAKGPWWELFQDTELNQLQARALSDNLPLKAAYHRVNQARARARISAADWLPTLSANPSWSRYRTSNTMGSGAFPTPTQTLNNFSVPFDLSYEIDIWGKIRRGFESAQNEFLASAADYQNVLFTLQSEVAVNYFQLRTVDHEIDILEQAVKLRQESLGIFDKRFQSGVTSELDVTRAKTELAAAQADLADAKRRRAEYENTLAVLCGTPPTQFAVESALISLDPPEIKPGLPSELLERRPDVAMAERTLAARNAEIGVAYTAFFPSISLTASGGFQSVELRDLFEWQSRVWSFGPTVNIPIFAGGRNAANLKEARAAYEEAVANYRQSVLVAFQDVDNALAGLRYLSEQRDFRLQALESARKSAYISITRYENGVVSYLDVIDSERSRLENELAYVRIQGEQMNTTVLLVKAIGGGWTPPTNGNANDRNKVVAHD